MKTMKTMVLELKRQKNGKMSEADANELAAILVKAGYMVSIRYVGKEKGGWIVQALDDAAASRVSGGGAYAAD